MNTLAFLYFVNFVGASIIYTNIEPTTKSCNNGNCSNNAKENRRKFQVWSEAAYQWIIQLNCTDSGILCGLECRVAKEQRRRDFRIYLTEPISGEKYSAVFLEGDSTKHRTFHDSVLVLDPFPAARFGHPIVAFYIDTNTNETYCDSVKGFMIGKR